MVKYFYQVILKYINRERGVFMNRRTIGIVKCIIIMGIDVWTCYYFTNDWQITTIISVCIALYAFLFGEMFITVKEGGIVLENLDQLTKGKLAGAVDLMLKQYEQKFGKRKKVKVYLIPDDSKFNAYAYGYRKIGITSDALSSMDMYSTAAVLSHELGHIEGLDVCVKRLLLANLFGILAILGISQLVCGAIVLLVCICIVWIMNSCLGLYIGLGLLKVLTKVGKGLISAVIILAQSFIALLERQSEFAADDFACILGFGMQLQMVLDRYIGENLPAQSLGDILYATHPKTKKRIARIEKKIGIEERTLANVRM